MIRRDNKVHQLLWNVAEVGSIIMGVCAALDLHGPGMVGAAFTALLVTAGAFVAAMSLERGAAGRPAP